MFEVRFDCPGILIQLPVKMIHIVTFIYTLPTGASQLDLNHDFVIILFFFLFSILAYLKWKSWLPFGKASFFKSILILKIYTI